ncbi:MAG: hypothetical protein WCJ58_05105 [bacterium]
MSWGFSKIRLFGFVILSVMVVLAGAFIAKSALTLVSEYNSRPETLGTTDTAVLVVNQFCGNNHLDIGEHCDGSALAGKTCWDFGFPAGNLSCHADCTFNYSNCYAIAPSLTPTLSATIIYTSLIPSPTSVTDILYLPTEAVTSIRPTASLIVKKTPFPSGKLPLPQTGEAESLSFSDWLMTPAAAYCGLSISGFSLTLGGIIFWRRKRHAVSGDRNSDDTM